MKINAIVCPNCYSVIYSRVNHDYRTCPCGSVSIDGGEYDKKKDRLGYNKISFTENINPNVIERKKLDIDVSIYELYDDWNKRIDKYGLIKGDILLEKAKKALES